MTNVNHASATLLGAPTKEDLFGNLFQYFVPESWEVFKREIVALASGKTQFNDEISILNIKEEHLILDLTLSIQPGHENDWSRILVSFINITDRKRAEKALKTSEERFQKAFMSAPTLMTLSYIEDGRYIDVNQRFCEISGFERVDVLGKTSLEIGWVSPEDRNRLIAELKKNGQVLGLELTLTAKDGHPVECLYSGEIVHVGDRNLLLSIAEDITERKAREQQQRLTTEILSIINQSESLPKMIGTILDSIKRHSGFDAVGIRLRKGDDYPYFVQEGFSEEFIRLENQLCSREKDGTLICDRTGRPLLECTCGLVLSGGTDPQNPLFSAAGSFWSNMADVLLTIPADQEPRRLPRNRCIHQGYMSVALIPIRIHEEIFGLLQLNDQLPNRFTAEMIRFFEGIGATIGVALARQMDSEAALESQERLDLALQSAEMGVWQINLVENTWIFDNQTCRLLGINPTTFHGASEEFYSVVHPDDVPTITSALMNAIENNRLYKPEYRILLPNNGIRFITAQARIEYDPSGKPIRVLGIIWDITDRKTTELLIEQQRDQMKRLAMKMTHILEDEQKRIAQELHDQLGQELTGAQMTAYSLTRQFKDNEDVRLKLERLMSLIDRAIKSMRKIATQLRPRILDELGLVEAIRWETEDFQKSSGIPCRLELPAHAFPPQTIDNDISIALFRGLQEALNNVAKHSKAHNVWIAFGEQEKELFLSIQDDGIGISPERRNNIKSLGIIGMQERMLSIGGSLTLDSVAGKGTTVILHSPKERL